MKISINKTKATLIALFLTLTIAVTLVALPTANAHTPAITVPTWTYASARNNVIGVNQQELIVYWTNAIPPTASGTYGDRWKFTVEVTKPDGSKDTLGPFTSDPIGGGFALYTPTAVGTYAVVAKLAAKVIDGTPNGFPPGFGPFSNGYDSVNDTYSASQSIPITFTVQQQPIQDFVEPPLPTNSYWTVPVTTLNRGWAPIVGNWLAAEAQTVGPTTGFAYGTGPESAHVLWTRPMATGGIMDARFGAAGYTTYYYNGFSLSPPIILNGVLYYNVENNPTEGWYAVNLYTGQTEYFHNTTGSVTGVGGGFDSVGGITGEALNFGQIYDYNSPNQVGGFAYLWSAPVSNFFAPLPAPPTWMMFDAFSGNYICSINNIPGFVTYGSPFFFGVDNNVYGQDGSITSYNIATIGNKNYLQIWNTSQVIWYNAYLNSLSPFGAANAYWMWRPTLNVTFDGNNGYSLNASIPTLPPGGMLAIREGKYVIGGTSGTWDTNGNPNTNSGTIWALSLARGQEGTLLWQFNYTPPPAPPASVTSGFFAMGALSGPTVDPEDNVFLFRAPLTGERYGYSLATGARLWGPSQPESAYNYYGVTDAIYQGSLYSTGYGGQLVAYNLQTGQVRWIYNASQVGFESPYGNFPTGIGAIADGKIYIGTGSHHEGGRDPYDRGPNLRCINASNGAELWKIYDYGISMPGGNGGSNYAIGDGYLIALNGYDSQIYCFGKGPTATTVTAPDTAVPLGSGVMIRGTVTDQSPGAKGAACVADADQEAWMEYLYMQQAIPAHAAGVQVTLTAADPNHNTQVIGTATTDMGGSYGIMWTPPVPGTYTIMATFAGSKSYGSSFATTYLGVGPASPSAQPTSQPTSPPAQTPTPAVSPSVSPPVSPSTAPTPASPPSNTAPSMTLYIVLAAVVIIIVIAAAAIVLRRRK